MFHNVPMVYYIYIYHGNIDIYIYIYTYNIHIYIHILIYIYKYNYIWYIYIVYIYISLDVFHISGSIPLGIRADSKRQRRERRPFDTSDSSALRKSSGRPALKTLGKWSFEWENHEKIKEKPLEMNGSSWENHGNIWKNTL